MPAPFSPASLRLVLTGAAAVVLVTLGWAGIRLRDVLRENEALRREAATAEITLRQVQAESAPLQEAALKSAALREQVTKLETALQQAETARAATAAPEAAGDSGPVRVRELEDLVTFLRGEISAAHETIARLEKEAEAADKTAAAPVKSSGRGRR